MWGTLPRLTPQDEIFRFIPTLVGNSRTKGFPPDRKPVHPHACGELALQFFNNFFISGSSPRLWGTHVIKDCYNAGIRFIPTLVGNSSEPLKRSVAVAVHPHACGELASPGLIMQPVTGSSPRLWGTLYLRRQSCLQLRFIPTLVGNSYTAANETISIAVHPHACGELVIR